MTITAQNRAIRSYRSRLRKLGIARFEVLALSCDRDLIRALAKRLTQDGAEASRIRSEIRQTIAEEPTQKGGILAALRRSPLVSLDQELNLEIVRSRDSGRKVDL